MIEIAYHFIANHANHATTPSRPPRPPRLPCFPCPRCHSGPFGGFYLWTMHFSLYRTAGVGCQTVIAQCKASWRLHKMSERLWLRAKRSEVFWAKISQSNHIFKRDLWSWFSSEIMIVTPVWARVTSGAVQCMQLWQSGLALIHFWENGEEN